MTRLRRTNSAGPGIHRVKSGRGFTYRDAHGVTIDDQELLDRIASLVIPPAWTDVWIAPYANGHIQAVGVDAAGRRQYLYHPAWREHEDRLKFTRSLALSESLPAARRQVTMDLRLDALPRQRILAAGFRMLDTGSLRVGTERYAAEHGSIGLTTLLCAHATVSGDDVELKFPAKSGHAWESTIHDADLAVVVRKLRRRGPTARLLSFKDDRGWHPVSPSEINDYVRERTHGDFTAKDFRTLHGTIAAAISLAKSDANTKTARERAVAQAMRDASAVLENTPAVARSSYVDPRVIDLFLRGQTIDRERLGAAETELRALLFD
ncbi:MAG TPA: DNA topoisomerase IB [Galbitalea sp.]